MEWRHGGLENKTLELRNVLLLVRAAGEDVGVGGHNRGSQLCRTVYCRSRMAGKHVPQISVQRYHGNDYNIHVHKCDPIRSTIP
jgi:hypothetical protein